MNRYRAVVTHEDDYWLAEVPGLPGAHAYARTLTKLRAELSDALILAADLPDHANILIDFEPGPSVPDADLLARMFAVAQERHEVACRETTVQERLIDAIHEMAARYSVRDTAGALDITPGRVSQLNNSR